MGHRATNIWQHPTSDVIQKLLWLNLKSARPRSVPSHASQRATLSYHLDVLSWKYDSVMFTIFYLWNYMVNCTQFFTMQCYITLYLTKKFHWSGKKGLFTAISNGVKFSRNIENPVYKRFLFNDDFLELYVVNNFETLHMHLGSVE